MDWKMSVTLRFLLIQLNSSNENEWKITSVYENSSFASESFFFYMIYFDAAGHAKTGRHLGHTKQRQLYCPETIKNNEQKINLMYFLL